MLQLDRHHSVLPLAHDIKYKLASRVINVKNHSARIATKRNISLKVIHDLQSTCKSRTAYSPSLPLTLAAIV